ncbi:MAG: aldo/keto reductase [Candidatus Bathyarchaeia archaeon]
MEYTRLGDSGLKISRIGVGTLQASRRHWGAEVNLDEIADAVKRSCELGINFIDTAETYGDGEAEELVGRVVKEIGRDRLVIATKVHGKHCRYNDLLKAAENSLKRLGLKEIDLYQIHWPDPWEQIPLSQTMAAAERLYKEGKVRAIGVSNFAVRDIEEAQAHLSSTEIVSDQVRYNLLQREIEHDLLQYCRDNGMSILAWSPLAQGILTGKYDLANKPVDPERSGNRLFAEHNLKQIMRLTAVLRRIAESRKKTAAQVAVNWLLKKASVVPIPGAKNPRQAEENAGAVGWSLTSRELRDIEEAYRTLDLSYYKYQ